MIGYARQKRRRVFFLAGRRVQVRHEIKEVAGVVGRRQAAAVQGRASSLCRRLPDVFPKTGSLLSSTLAILGRRKLPSIPAFFGAEVFQTRDLLTGPSTAVVEVFRSTPDSRKFHRPRTWRNGKSRAIWPLKNRDWLPDARKCSRKFTGARVPVPAFQHAPNGLLPSAIVRAL